MIDRVVRMARRTACALLVFGLCEVAQAHAHLQSAVPADGSVVTASPSTIVLSFSEPARLAAVWVQKQGGEKKRIESLPTEAARQISVSIPQLTPGSYVVSWRVVGADSHVVPGQIRFTIAAAGSSSAPGQP